MEVQADSDIHRLPVGCKFYRVNTLLGVVGVENKHFCCGYDSHYNNARLFAKDLMHSNGDVIHSEANKLFIKLVA